MLTFLEELFEIKNRFSSNNEGKSDFEINHNDKEDYNEEIESNERV